MSNPTKDITFRQLLALVNLALWNKEPDESLFAEMSAKDWDGLYQFAIQHGVMAIAFDGMMRLSKDLQPPLKLRLTWGIGVERIEQDYNLKLSVADELAEIFSQEQIRMLIFKGFSLSNYYPIPSHREFGDIDIYLFGEHTKGDELIRQIGAIGKEYDGDKHSNLLYKNVVIENHAYFLNVHDSVKIAKLNDTLLDILENDLSEKHRQANRSFFPPSDFTAIFFTIHAIKHLSTEPMLLRTYCDWALFLQANINELDIEKWRAALTEAGFLDVAEALTTLTFRWLGPFPVENFVTKKHPDWENLLTKEMTEPPYPPYEETTRWRTLLYRYKRFRITYKRRIALYGGNFFTYFFPSLIHYIKHPQAIFKFH
ncbi:nucleotidyltransferase family protein [Dysgonomonas sp. 511]|uniref:nucleotidyltransferase family protein n=1 Tax=Dysgonomonas sp. 511 TaxID=2302930 RepID=UPI0013D0CF6E|nr:nucleotidyltransferase family protein [Dysgonomonas sp. 511]NDV78073.1 hypothetical protein [Dysgonomonas sp. 511]